MAGISSNLLKDKKEKILSLWEARSKKEVASADTFLRLSLRDSIPVYLDHLSEALATNLRMDFKSVFARDKEGTRIGKLHGADRAGNKNYILTEVIYEYHILREVIFEALEEGGPLSSIQRDIILDSIEQAVNDAAVEFSDVHMDIQQKFVNTLTHDLKTPITSALIGAQLIMRTPNLPESVINSSKRIEGSLNRLTAMIHDLLDGSRLRAGEKLDLQVEPGDIDAMLRKVIEEMSLVHGDRFVLESDGKTEGVWDLNGLRRAVENLIGNAVKYGSASTPITVSLERTKAGIELAVHNEGSVIAADEIPRLFKDFHRSKSAQEGSETGWGLGLTLVKGMADAHHGKVSVESAAGKGTTFCISMPTQSA
jgi:signal transduction histidine kinase